MSAGNTEEEKKLDIDILAASKDENMVLFGRQPGSVLAKSSTQANLRSNKAWVGNTTAKTPIRHRPNQPSSA